MVSGYYIGWDRRAQWFLGWDRHEKEGTLNANGTTIYNPTVSVSKDGVCISAQFNERKVEADGTVDLYPAGCWFHLSPRAAAQLRDGLRDYKTEEELAEEAKMLRVLGEIRAGV